MTGQPVYIAGAGIISPLGKGLTATRQALRDNISAIAPLTLFPLRQGQPLPVGQTAEPETGLWPPRTHRLAREAAAMALQNYGDRNPDRLLQEMKAWSQGTWLEKRAAAAALCEPRLLRRMEDPGPVFDLLDQMTQSLYESRDRTSEDLKVLRQGLGYCWSVAAVSAPDAGKSRMEHWLVQTDPDIRWIMKENLKKNRLKKRRPKKKPRIKKNSRSRK